MIERNWYKCYGESWTGMIDPDSFAHSAKFSRALIRCIYQHCIEQSYLHEGNTVIDPFGGVALGALHAMHNGLHWIGIELEPCFVTLGQANIDLWNDRFAQHMPHWGTAQLLQGDSRQLARVVGEAGGVVSSPPYAESLGNGKSGIDWSKQADRETSHSHGWDGETYGQRTGQLGSMRDTDHAEAVAATCVSSPPYADQDNDWQRLNNIPGRVVLGQDNYGATPDQLGAMPAGEWQAAGAVSSPPYEDQNACNDPKYHANRKNPGGPLHGDYGNASGNLGNERGDIFWSAARLIVQQTHQVLAPGAVAIWVCKRFVRNKQIVDFSRQWCELCEACGFEITEWIKAWLVEDRGAQWRLDGELEERTVERKSFFRRLHQGKFPELAIDWEDVIVMRKVKESSS